MLSFDTVHALTMCLLHAPHAVPAGPVPPGLLGTLVLAQDHPLDPADPRVRQLRTLHLSLLGDARRHQNLPTALHQIADALAARDPRLPGHAPAGAGPLHPEDLAVLGLALREPRPGARLLAWAVSYDDLHADPGHLHRVRRVEAVDVDGRVYQLSLHPGETHPVVLVDEQPDPGDLPATYPPLARLATAALPAQT